LEVVQEAWASCKRSKGSKKCKRRKRRKRCRLQEPEVSPRGSAKIAGGGREAIFALIVLIFAPILPI
jgi:hypothetical protein